LTIIHYTTIKYDLKIEYKWIKSHQNNNNINDVADKLANEALESTRNIFNTNCEIIDRSNIELIK